MEGGKNGGAEWWLKLDLDVGIVEELLVAQMQTHTQKKAVLSDTGKKKYKKISRISK